MAGVANNPNSPRQKMINLMYLVFIAMLALNVSSEVLDGFELVESSLYASTQNSTRRNEEIKASLERAYLANETKVSEWYEKGVKVKGQSDDLYNYIDELKLRIVQEADGAKGEVNNIKQKDHLEAASRVMLAPIVGEGKKLKERIENYRTAMSEIIDDPGKKAIFESVLSTEAPGKAGIIAQSWEEVLFDNMPVGAAITLLTKIQSDIRFVEGETLSTLITNVDVGDFRVNQIAAFVVPRSQIVASGMPFEAQIVLAAIDSTKQPEYYLGETLLSDNMIIQGTSGTGDRVISGRVVADGQTYPYEARYSVTESSATIAPILMTFLYESMDNDLRVALPGVPSGNITATLRGGAGNIRQKDEHRNTNIWTVSGLNTSSENIEVVLSADVGGRTVSASEMFRVRPLPEPLPYIGYVDVEGRTRKFVGGNISKRNLTASAGVSASVDDGLLNIPYRVTGFTMRTFDNRGNSIPEISNSGEYTARQREAIRDMPTGTRFYITDVRALDLEGRPMTLTFPLQVIVTN